MSRLYILTVGFVIVAILIYVRKSDKAKTIAAGKGLVINKEWLAVNSNPMTPKEELRPGDQTFLTFPEWYLVFSPEEQAQYYKTKTSTSFPFLSHVGQMWDSYGVMKDQIRGNFPVNTGYHFMIWVIASSTTVEYGAKALYETIIGRLTDTKEVITGEDQFNAEFTQRYVDFIKDRPWYEFNFKNELKQLWNIPFSGGHYIRKVERRFALTSEFAVKFIYGKLIGVGTQTVYGAALPTTVVLVDRMPENFSPENVIKEFDNKTVLLKLARYDKFNAAACTLAQQGINFIEIAGNTSAILITVLVPATTDLQSDNIRIVFTQPVASDLSRKRVAVAVRVRDLSSTLAYLKSNDIFIEHIFDF